MIPGPGRGGTWHFRDEGRAAEMVQANIVNRFSSLM